MGIWYAVKYGVLRLFAVCTPKGVHSRMYEYIYIITRRRGANAAHTRTCI